MPGLELYKNPVTADVTLGLGDHTLLDDITITKDNSLLSIRHKYSPTTAMDLEIYSILGSKIMQPITLEEVTIIDTNPWSKGVYIMVFTIEGSRVAKKVLIN